LPEKPAPHCREQPFSNPDPVFRPPHVPVLRKFVKESGGIDYAKESMNKYYQRSIELFQEFPDSEYKTSLMQLVQFTIERKN
jgi:octaprenyl-diphosphate synthase